MNNKIKIIGGEWRSRQLLISESPGLRPTPARVRETLFNWLQYDIVASRCLDLFAGSGALGFEAASRGAKSVMLVENNQNAFKMLQQNINQLNANNIDIIHSDAMNVFNKTSLQFDLVFLDPPFKQNLVQRSSYMLEEKNLLAQHSKIYIEVEKQLVLDNLPRNWQCLKSKTAGEVSYSLFERR